MRDVLDRIGRGETPEIGGRRLRGRQVLGKIRELFDARAAAGEGSAIILTYYGEPWAILSRDPEEAGGE